MSQIAVPVREMMDAKPRRWSVLAVGGLLATAVAVGGYYLVVNRSTSASIGSAGLPTFEVALMDLPIRFSKDGELEATENIEVSCRVEGQTTVLSVVKEGVNVKKGDLLATLDSSAINQKIEDTTLELQKADAELTTATEMVEIQRLSNSANLEAADVALLLAKLDYEQYTEGTYPAQVKAAETTAEMAVNTLQTKTEELGQTRELATKGFVMASDVKNDELELTTARQALDKAQTDLNVLTKYTHAADLAAKKNAVAQADQKLARTKRENASNLSQKTADANAKSAALSTLKRRMQRLQQQLAACTVMAPADGIVIYATSGDRNAQNPLQEGASVRERQPMFRLPDTSHMKAVVRVQESQVTRLKPGMRASVKVVGIPQPIGATLSNISVLADSSQRWWNPDLKEYPVELTLDETPAGVKPGIGVTTEIFIDRLEDVPAVPMAAVYAAGPDSYVFVKSGDTVKPTKIKLGASNDTHIVIDEGAPPAGTSVVLLQAGQGRSLLESAGIKLVTAPTTQPGERRKRNGPPKDGEPQVSKVE